MLVRRANLKETTFLCAGGPNFGLQLSRFRPVLIYDMHERKFHQPCSGLDGMLLSSLEAAAISHFRIYCNENKTKVTSTLLTFNVILSQYKESHLYSV